MKCAVVRIDQSPMNERRWILTLACGCEIWITSAQPPKATTGMCQTPTVHMSFEKRAMAASYKLHTSGNFELDPTLDGITHINVYSKSTTGTGRFWSNFTRAPFEHPLDGHFESVEGYWYWLGVDVANPERDKLRQTWGFLAKKLGRDLRAPDWAAADFKDRIRAALRLKGRAFPEELRVLRLITLPLAHYYVTPIGIVDMSHEAQWILDELEAMRACKRPSKAVQRELRGERNAQ